MLRMRGKYGLMVDADAATDIEDLDRLLIRMRDIEAKVVVDGKHSSHGLVVGSRAHMEGEAVATVSDEFLVPFFSVFCVFSW